MQNYPEDHTIVTITNPNNQRERKYMTTGTRKTPLQM